MTYYEARYEYSPGVYCQVRLPDDLDVYAVDWAKREWGDKLVEVIAVTRIVKYNREVIDTRAESAVSVDDGWE